MDAYLILENGMVFKGKSAGAQKEVISELVFNTSMTGYLEVMTDPSYAGQAVCMTYPLIGNYGICNEDAESVSPWLDGFITRELSNSPGNFRSEESINDYLIRHNIPAIYGVDTRKLTRMLRDYGTMNCIITTDSGYLDRLGTVKPSRLAKVREYTTGKVVNKVTCSDVSRVSPDNVPIKKIALLDLGAKDNIVRSLVKLGCEVTVYPAHTLAVDIINSRPDGIMLSNGPGDPAVCTDIIEQLKLIYDTDIPVFAICLGHQLMALAAGAKTVKMKYGHRGGNHPVKDLKTGRVYISSQNHGYVVDSDSVNPNIAVPSFINVNDNTNEGLEYVGRNIYTVQFHPESCPGPRDSEYLFRRFLESM